MNEENEIEEKKPKKVIAVVWSNRSEEGLLRPVIEELKKDDVNFVVDEWKIPDDIFKVAEYVTDLAYRDEPLPDVAITPYDRPPVTLMAFFLYHVHVPLVQLHAGDISSGTFDDMDRWSISAWATYHFCAGPKQAERLHDFLDTIGRDRLTRRVSVSGVTNLDDINDMSEPPDGDYDMVLYNPPTACPEKINAEVTEIVNMLDKDTYWLVPNDDPGSDYIKYLTSTAAGFVKTIHKTPTMPHTTFLGLLSRAKRVIGNSSALFFEAPYFDCEIIQIGERNKVRESVDLRPGGSERIVRTLREWLESTDS